MNMWLAFTRQRCHANALFFNPKIRVHVSHQAHALVFLPSQAYKSIYFSKLAAWRLARILKSIYLCPGLELKTRGSGEGSSLPARFLLTIASALKHMYNYLPWPSNMRTADHVLAMRIEEGAAGYGIYVMLLELLRDSETRSLVLNPKNLAFAINEPDLGLVERVITKYSLFDVKDDNTFTSPWLEQQMQEYDKKKIAASEAGKRGAAKRYGQVVGQKPATDSDPIATPCPPPLGSHGNIINNILPDKPNQSKSKLLGMAYEGLTGEDLFNIARKDSGPVSTITRQWQLGKQRELDEQRGRDKHNLDAVLEACDYFNLGDSCYSFLLRYTDLGRVGSAHMVDLIALYHRSKAEKFKPRFPAEYVIVKLLQS